MVMFEYLYAVQKLLLFYFSVSHIGTHSHIHTFTHDIEIVFITVIITVN